jgi:hypothetical protein
LPALTGGPTQFHAGYALFLAIKRYRKKTMSPRTLTFTGSSLFESVNLIVQDRVVGPANPTPTSHSPKGRSVKLAPPFVTNALRKDLRKRIDLIQTDISAIDKLLSDFIAVTQERVEASNSPRSGIRPWVG